MWQVLTFGNIGALQLYLRTQQTSDPGAGANAVALAKVAAIYFDSASGQHILVLAP